MANADIARSLLEELESFDAGVPDLAALQGALIAHGSALEAMPWDWRSRLNGWEGAPELARFTGTEAEQAEVAGRVISEVRRALTDQGIV